MDYHNATDEELMLAYQKGDYHSFEFLLQKHKNGIFNFLYRLIGQGENVEEAFQEVFIRVIRSTDSYTPSAKFTTWVYTIARNYCIDFSRKKRFRKTTSLDETDSLNDNENQFKLEERLPGCDPTPLSEVSAKDLAQKIDLALHQINPDQKEVFLMREQQGLSFDEISLIVGTSVNTVKSRMRYALIALQYELKKMGVVDRE